SNLTPAEKELYTLVNQERKQRDLPLFALDSHLVAAARKHSQETARVRKLSHKFPDEPEIKTRLAQAGGKFDSVAENVAESDSAQNAHLELMHSTRHRAKSPNRAYHANRSGITMTTCG